MEDVIRINDMDQGQQQHQINSLNMVMVRMINMLEDG